MEKDTVTVEVARPSAVFAPDSAFADLKLAPETVANVKHMLACREYTALFTAVAASKGKLTVTLDGKDITMQAGRHFFSTMTDLTGKKPSSA